VKKIGIAADGECAGARHNALAMKIGLGLVAVGIAGISAHIYFSSPAAAVPRRASMPHCVRKKRVGSQEPAHPGKVDGYGTIMVPGVKMISFT